MNNSGSSRKDSEEEEYPQKLASVQTRTVDAYNDYVRNIPYEESSSHPSRGGLSNVGVRLILLGIAAIIAIKIFSPHSSNPVNASPSSQIITLPESDPSSKPNLALNLNQPLHANPPPAVIAKAATEPVMSAAEKKKMRRNSEYRMMLRVDWDRMLEHTERPKYGPHAKDSLPRETPVVTGKEDENIRYAEGAISRYAQHFAADDPSFIAVVGKCSLQGSGIHYVTAEGKRSDLDTDIPPVPLIEIAEKILAPDSMIDKYVFIFKDGIEVQDVEGHLLQEIDSKDFKTK